MTVPDIPGLTFTHLEANFDHEKWQCEGQGVVSYGYTPEHAHGKWEDDFVTHIHIQRAAKRIAENPGEGIVT